MKYRFLIATVTAFAALACAAIAVASGGAPTSVTIQGTNGDYHGRIDSPKLHRCVKDRKVVVYKQKGAEQKPRDDRKIGSDTASVMGDVGFWSAGNTGFKHGKFYARAPGTDGCHAGHSDTISR